MQNDLAARCPEADTLLALLEGHLARDRFDDVGRHVAACAACGGLVAELAVSRAGASRSRSVGETDHGDASLASLERVDPDRFVVGREIAHGGMGRIVEAWDRRHRRDVAVKLLLRTESAAARARFVREARVTARLEHPGIVPLYEAGRWSDDEPFLLMKLVRGEPLDAVVRAKPTLGERLSLLPNVVAMTEALAYAHDQGVVHRDLKPANVLIGAFGETVVIDWGLAKVVGEEELADGGARSSGTDASDDASDAIDDALTQAGAAIGTPWYMPPEQARGETIDARADVYALGALLYHVLAGAPPYAGATAKSAIERVLAGPPPPLASRAAGVPPDLATIVEKAMARDLADRYADARAMAADLRRFTAGQLVGAHEYSLVSLLRRWVSRHRAVVATACVLLVALVTSSALSVRRIVRERERADALSLTAVTQRDAAEKLAGFVLGRLRERLEALGKLDLLAGVGAEVDGYYRTLDPTRDARDAATLVRRGRALFALVEVERRTRDWPAGIALAQSAIEAFELAAARDPRDAEAGSLAVAARASLAGVLENAGRTDDGLAEAARAMDAADALLARAPDDARAWVAAAFADSRGAFLRASHADVQGGRSAAGRARDRIARARAGGDLDAFWHDLLGSAYRNLGGFSTRAQDWAATAETCRAAIELRRAQLRAQPDHVERTAALAYMLRGLAFAAEKLGDHDAALDALRESIALRAWLLEREPNDTTARYDQGIALAMSCDLVRGWRGAKDAQKDCDAARATLAALVAARPGDAKARDALSRALRGVGRTALAAGDREGAWRAFDEAVTYAQSAAASDPASFALESSLVMSLDGRALAASGLGRGDAAREDAADAVARVRKQVAAHPEMAQFASDLAQRLLTAGDVARRAGDATAARRAYAEALDHAERALAVDRDDVETQVVVAIACARAAGVAREPASGAALRARASAIVAQLESAKKISPEDRAKVSDAR